MVQDLSLGSKLDGVFVDDEDRLAFARHPVPTSADVLAILDRIARRLADEARDDRVDEGVDVLAQGKAEEVPLEVPQISFDERLKRWSAQLGIQRVASRSPNRI